jgi:transcriptional regulator with XRE-family HTH domain
VAAKTLTWQDKATAARKKRGWSARYLATRMGEKERNVRNWLSGSARPINEMAVVARVAAALEVDKETLLDGQPEEPTRLPRSLRIPEELLRKVPARVRRLLYALSDDETTEHLLACLELYERARRRG